MTPAEAWRLFDVLCDDPSSHTFAAIAELDRPVTREELVLMDLYDLLYQSWPRKRRFSPHWARPKVKKRVDREKQRRIRATLRALGHGDLIDDIERKEAK